MNEMIFVPIFGLLFLLPVAIYILTVYCWYKIMQKAGYDNLGLIAIFPPLHVVLIAILAFSNWHAVREPPVTTAVTPVNMS